MNKVEKKLACTVCGNIEDKPFDVFDECKFGCGGHYVPYSGEIIYIGDYRHVKNTANPTKL